MEDYSRIDPLLPRIFAHVESQYPDSRGKAWQFALGPGGGSLIKARFTGPDPVVLRRLAERAKAVYAREGAVGVRDDWGEMVKVMRPRIDERNARRVGLSQGDVSKAIAAHFDGSVIGLLREESELHLIIFRPVAEERGRIERIREVHVFSLRTGRYVPIAQVVDRFDLVLENARLRRFNRALAIMAQADPAPGENAAELFDRRPRGHTPPLGPFLQEPRGGHHLGAQLRHHPDSHRGAGALRRFLPHSRR